MANKPKKDRDAELDAFWDIDSLIPRRRAAHDPSDTEATEIVLEPKPSTAPEKSTRTSFFASAPIEDKPVSAAEKIPPADENRPKARFIPPHTADEEARRPVPDEEYVPQNALIRRVRLYRNKSTYRYYEDFLRHAKKLHPVVGVECPRVPFFAYVPQYSQMSRSQLGWYLRWRESVRSGVYSDTDYSYLLLYCYELISLSETLEPLYVQRMLCELWLHYREVFRQLDSSLPEWICDHALIHRLPAPAELPLARRSDLMAHCTLKEFYVPADEQDVHIRALLAFCSNYDYRKSKFYTEERRELFDRTVMGAIKTLTEHTGADGKLFVSLKMEDSRLSRDAYGGALCPMRIKRRIEVDFCSFSRSHELRYLVTDAIKYTENKLRAHWGIRSRLSIYALPTPIRELLDAYTRDLLPVGKAQAKADEPAPYEALYDLPRSALSLSRAAEIERLSWDTTERLVEAFGETSAEDVQPNSAHVPQKAQFSAPPSAPFSKAPLSAPPSAPFSKAPQIPVSAPPLPTAPSVDAEGVDKSAFANYLPFLRAVSEQNAAAQKTAARSLGLPLDVLADEVNALAADTLGDILLEESESGYAVLEDYRELLAEILE